MSNKEKWAVTVMANRVDDEGIPITKDDADMTLAFHVDAENNPQAVALEVTQFLIDVVLSETLAGAYEEAKNKAKDKAAKRAKSRREIDELWDEMQAYADNPF